MKVSDLSFVEINEQNIDVFKNLAQGYEAEFSDITNRLPNELGIFQVDIYPAAPYRGYLAYCGNIPVGFGVADIESDIKDIFEFYIIPSMRKKRLGYALAVMVFSKYPGYWQVRQIKGADGATKFWRNTVKRYTADKFEELTILDPLWGDVTCQRFQSISNDKVK